MLIYQHLAFQLLQPLEEAGQGSAKGFKIVTK